MNDAKRPGAELPLEFLSRSWSASAADVSRALAAAAPPAPPLGAGAIAEDVAAELDGDGAAGSSFSFASAATSQLVLDRIMAPSQEASPLTSGRLSHSSGPLTGGGSLSDSPPVSPDINDTKFCRAASTPKPQVAYQRGGSKTVGRWLKDRRERRKEESRARNAQAHAAVSVAAVAAAVAAVAAATAAAASARKDRGGRADATVASAAKLVAAQCVEAAEAAGADRDALAAAVASAVSVRTPDDVATVTAAAATALRCSATLKARVLKEAWNSAAVIPVEKGAMGHHRKQQQQLLQMERRERELESSHSGSMSSSSFGDDLIAPSAEENTFLGTCNLELLARGTQLLKRTRKGALHWKMASAYISRSGQVTLKTKSKHVGGTITKKKKSVVVEVCCDVAAWPGRHLLDGGDRRRYFGLRTAERRVIEFECAGQAEYDMWTRGVARLLSVVDGRKRLMP